MKTRNFIIIAACVCGLFLVVPSGFAQGGLTPPGPPAPTMKTLAQIEPRTAITNSGAVTISQPGSYYLTTNITVSSGNGVMINANNVTLDLNGYTIASTAPSAAGTGIMLAGVRTNITILNGFISGGVTNNGGAFTGSGFANGIYYQSDYPYNVRVSGVSVWGCLVHGIGIAWNSTIIESCRVDTVGSYGMLAQVVSDSVAVNCGYDGIDAYTAINCLGQSVGNGIGVDAVNANNCNGSSHSGRGVTGYTALNCMGTSDSDAGLACSAACNCYGSSGTDDGIIASVANNCCGNSNGNGTGVAAQYIAIGCYGYSNSGTGLSAFIANSCWGVSSSGTPMSVANKYNMP